MHHIMECICIFTEDASHSAGGASSTADEDTQVTQHGVCITLISY